MEQQRFPDLAGRSSEAPGGGLIKMQNSGSSCGDCLSFGLGMQDSPPGDSDDYPSLGTPELRHFWN